MAVHQRSYNNRDLVGGPFCIMSIHLDTLFAMCKCPRKAIMYIRHTDRDIGRLAKLIMTCNESIEIEHGHNQMSYYKKWEGSLDE